MLTSQFLECRVELLRHLVLPSEAGHAKINLNVPGWRFEHGKKYVLAPWALITPAFAREERHKPLHFVTTRDAD